ncbi:MAG: glycosyltransferase [Candidatus Binatia bacterium]
MRILLLSNPGSAHTIKWATSLAEQGLDLCLFGLQNYDVSLYENYKNIQVYSLRLPSSIAEVRATKIAKLIYLKAVPRLRRMIVDFQPDILHAHFASSYGLIGALSGFHPYLVSVWGADIFEFPRKSFVHRALIKFTLRKADSVLSTSRVMAKETTRYTEKPIEVTPFGIDLERFKPRAVTSLFAKDDIVIGTVKGLDKTYGVEYLIQAFGILAKKYPNLPLKLLIVGGGPLEMPLKKLAKELGIENRTTFAGRVHYDQIVDYDNMLTIFVALSAESESFGVAILEASACEKPVVVTNIGGLPEVVEHRVTGMVVPPQHPEAAAAAIEQLIHDEDLRWKMGKAGRERVKRLYDWNVNVAQMIRIYRDVAR